MSAKEKLRELELQLAKIDREINIRNQFKEYHKNDLLEYKKKYKDLKFKNIWIKILCIFEFIFYHRLTLLERRIYNESISRGKNISHTKQVLFMTVPVYDNLNYPKRQFLYFKEYANSKGYLIH